MTAVVQAKAWYASKLVWLGVLQFAAGLAEVVSTTPIFEGSEVAGFAAMATGALTAALRFVTDKPVAASAKPVQVKD